MKRTIGVLLLALVPSLGAAGDGFADGADLLDWMKALERVEGDPGDSQAVAKAARVMGYVMAVADMNQGTMLCVPPGVGAKQLIAIVHKFLHKSPEVWNLRASGLVVIALRPTFPCKR